MRPRILAAAVVALGLVAAAFVLLARKGADGGPGDSTPPPAGKARVVVRVLGEDDAPVVGAYVGVLAIEMTDHVKRPGDEEHFLPLDGARRTANLFVPYKLFTNTAGVAESEIDTSHGIRHVMVVAIAGSRVGSAGPFEVPSSRILRADVRLAEGIVAVGTVTDESGTPYAGGTLHFGWVGADQEDLSRPTDWKWDDIGNDGRFRIGPIVSRDGGGEVELIAMVPGQDDQRVRLPSWRGESGNLSIVVPRR